jgi:hypothetical protein
VAWLAGLATCFAPGWAADSCTSQGYNNNAAVRLNKLCLYFPAAENAQFPEFGQNAWPTSPARRFDLADLASYQGTPSELQQAVVDVP